MKARIIMTVMVLLVSAAGHIRSQSVPEENAPRPPFDAESVTDSNDSFLKPPSLKGLQKAPGIPELPDPTEKDKVGGVPVQDILWLCPAMAVAYGIYRRRKRREWLQQHKNP